VPVLSQYVRGVENAVCRLDSVPTPEHGQVEDDRLLQHDLLLGPRHSLLPPATAPPAAAP